MENVETIFSSCGASATSGRFRRATPTRSSRRVRKDDAEPQSLATPTGTRRVPMVRLVRFHYITSSWNDVGSTPKRTKSSSLRTSKRTRRLPQRHVFPDMPKLRLGMAPFVLWDYTGNGAAAPVQPSVLHPRRPRKRPAPPGIESRNSNPPPASVNEPPRSPPANPCRRGPSVSSPRRRRGFGLFGKAENRHPALPAPHHPSPPPAWGISVVC